MFFVIFVVKMHILGCILRIKLIFWLYFGDKIHIRHVLKTYFEMTMLPRKSYCYFDIDVIDIYIYIQGGNELAVCFNPWWLH
jgi:hypothetical protein